MGLQCTGDTPLNPHEIEHDGTTNTEVTFSDLIVGGPPNQHVVDGEASTSDEVPDTIVVSEWAVVNNNQKEAVDDEAGLNTVIGAASQAGPLCKTSNGNPVLDRSRGGCTVEAGRHAGWAITDEISMYVQQREGIVALSHKSGRDGLTMMLGYRTKVNGAGANMEAFDNALAMVVANEMRPPPSEQTSGSGSADSNFGVVTRPAAEKTTGHTEAAAGKKKRHTKKNRCS